MRLMEVRISGYRSIPFRADVTSADGGHFRFAKTVHLEWHRDAFQVQFPTARTRGGPMLSAIIGANSAGKSTILQAMDLAFGNASKLDEAMFNSKRTELPVVVELTVQGAIAELGPWHETNCLPHGRQHTLTVAHIWTGSGRARFIRREDGRYHKQSASDREMCASLMPEFRIIWADTRLNDGANPDKKNLLGDLVEALLTARDGDQSSIVLRVDELIRELRHLVDRDDSAGLALWRDIEELEESLSAGLLSITPQRSRVRFHLDQNVPSLRSIFTKGVLSIDNGVELAFDQHGLGLQRSFVVSALNAWCATIRDADRDYVFAIEEPEIYLHPHATRVLLNTLEQVAEHDQVIFTTHSSEFVNRAPLGNIVTVQRCDHDGQVRSRATRPRLGSLRADDLRKVQRYLQEDRSDMLFARSVLLVEGQAELFAMPRFARTLGMDLDGNGLSVVLVNGLGNFRTYHQILTAFRIPHVILVDGDGRRKYRKQEYKDAADAVFVLPQDFEHAMVDALSPERLTELMNECRRQRGMATKSFAPRGKQAAKALAGLGKPLVGRVAGSLLTKEEIERMDVVAEALRAMEALPAQNEEGAPVR